MIEATIFAADSGRIKRTIEVLDEDEVLMNLDAGDGWVTGMFSEDTHYASMSPEGWRVDFRPLPTTFPETVVAPFTFNLTPGEEITITNELEEIYHATADDKPLEVGSAGTLTVSVTSPWPAQDWTGTVEVTDAND